MFLGKFSIWFDWEREIMHVETVYWNNPNISMKKYPDSFVICLIFDHVIDLQWHF